MKSLTSNKIIMKEYCLDEKELLDTFNKCLKYYLSMEELKPFIQENYFKLEMRLNKRYQK